MKIREYFSKEDKLTPSDLGVTAWETAGRRIGPLYSQAANDAKEMAKLSTQSFDLEAKSVSEYDRQLEKIQQLKHARGSGGGGVGGAGDKSPKQPQSSAGHRMTAAATEEVGRGLLGPGTQYDDKGNIIHHARLVGPESDGSAAAIGQAKADQVAAQKSAAIGSSVFGGDYWPPNTVGNPPQTGQWQSATPNDVGRDTGLAELPGTFYLPGTSIPLYATAHSPWFNKGSTPPATSASDVGAFLQNGFNTLSDAVDVAYQRVKAWWPGTNTPPPAADRPWSSGDPADQTQDQTPAMAQSWAATGATPPPADGLPWSTQQPQPGDSNYQFTQPQPAAGTENSPLPAPDVVP
jgi:hypothetical protein